MEGAANTWFRRVRPLRLVLASVAATALLIEFAVRIATGAPFVLGGPNSDRYVIRDPLLGTLPRPGLHFHHPKGFTMTIGEHSIRSNGTAPPHGERPLALAVGDSFAFGDQVDDEDSWPAVLERLRGQRVLNAGVPGFGLDQAILRAEQLVDVYHPDVIIVGFIPHDVRRCAMSFWSGRAKPYFDVDTGELKFHPAVVPPPAPDALLKHLLSYSVALDMLFPRYLHWQGPEEAVVHPHAVEVTCALMSRLAALGRARHIRIVVVAHPQVPEIVPEQREMAQRVLACARAEHLEALDLFPVFEQRTAEERARLFHGHLSVAGNRLVAAEIARALATPTAPPW
jgi:hypothetical protein